MNFWNSFILSFITFSSEFSTIFKGIYFGGYQDTKSTKNKIGPPACEGRGTPARNLHGFLVPPQVSGTGTDSGTCQLLSKKILKQNGQELTELWCYKFPYHMLISYLSSSLPHCHRTHLWYCYICYRLSIVSVRLNLITYRPIVSLLPSKYRTKVDKWHV